MNTKTIFRAIKFHIPILLLVFPIWVNSQTATIQIDVLAGQKPISPYLFGRNNSVETSTSSSTWQKYRDAGVRMFRENGGNNATKYNWRLKLSSHPDWYNNVYANNWDAESKALQNNMSGVTCQWSFQLIGKVASSTSYNFNDWAYNQSSWWSGCAQNLAGGGIVNAAGGSVATTNGNPDLYLKSWPADSTVKILDHWFGPNSLGFDTLIFRYWNMDNEPEIWNGTHDDVMPAQLSAEDFMQRYFEVAKKARAKFPSIKLCGPVACNEWQWFNWNNNLISSGGKNYTWLEYFIKRIGEEQTASGVRLLDVLDLHFYPGESSVTDIVQLHRVFFDKTYNYPGANGLKKLNGGWDNSLTKEYIFERCNTWLTTYIGASHGITLGISEMDVESKTPSVLANWHASMLGTFADNGVEFFTPWTWKIGMWETVHLFSRYGKPIRVKSTSSVEQYVSAYSSVSTDNDSLTIILVNRSLTDTYTTTVNISNFTAANGNYKSLTLSSLPATETFISHTQNALKTGTVALSDNALSVSVPPLSVKALVLANNSLTSQPVLVQNQLHSAYYRKPGTICVNYNLSVSSPVSLQLYTIQGMRIKTKEYRLQASDYYTDELDCAGLTKGMYILHLKAGNKTETTKIFVP